LRRAVDEAATRIARHPELGRLRPEIAEAPYRLLALAAFPYLIVYNAQRTPPRILRVLHGARDLPDVLRDL
jgi:toxin ParE1/3/4